jgi:Glycosyltransferases, probably involved in cell wall biogenesis
MIMVYVISILFILYTFLIWYYWYGWKSLKEITPRNESNHFTTISVIVPARNEAGNIVRLLQALKDQNYPQDYIEVIIVDDFSTDNTASLARSFSMTNLYVINPKQHSKQSSKKTAIEAGILASNGQLIITTDADCVPLPTWLKSINQFYTETNPEMIAAPVKMKYGNSLLDKFQALDFLTLQGITGGSIQSNLHVMCNGANLAYSRKAFMYVNGFKGIDHVASGDDLLLMYKIKQKYPGKVQFLKNKHAIVQTLPQSRLKGFFNQRKRWASKTFAYQERILIAILAFVYLFNCFLLGVIVAGFYNSTYWLLVLLLIILKTIVEWPFIYTVADYYNEKKLLKYFIFFQPFHIFYTVITGIISQTSQYSWKGRKLN